MREYRYVAYGVGVASDVALPELGRPQPAPVEVVLRFGPNPSLELPREADWATAVGEPAETPVMQALRREGWLWFRFELGGLFAWHAAKRTVHVIAPNVPSATLRHLVLDQLVPRVLHELGHVVLHASAVAIDERVVAFSAPSGTGKSTLAASFVKAGAPLVSDDALRIEAATGAAHVAYPALRLWHESMQALDFGGANASEVAHYTAKKRVAIGEAPAGEAPRPLERLYLLRRDPGAARVRIERVAPLERLPELMRASFRAPVPGPARLRAEFSSLGALLDRVSICQLTLPDDLSALTHVHEAVRADLAQSPLEASRSFRSQHSS